MRPSRLALALPPLLGLAAPTAGGFEGLFAFPEPEAAAEAAPPPQAAAVPGLPGFSGPGGSPGRIGAGLPSLRELSERGPEAIVIPASAGPSAVPALDGTLSESAQAAVPAPAARTTGPDEAICIQAIREAERAQGIPRDLLLAIGLQEAGMSFQGSPTIWPWSVNVEGRGQRFDTRAEAEAFVEGQLAQGIRSIDVGCLQINLRWHPDAFPSPAAGFDPDLNAAYSADFLRRLHDETGDWLEAAGRYHSATPAQKATYQAGIERQLALLETEGADFDALAMRAASAPLPVMAMPPGVRVAMGETRQFNPLRAPARGRRAPGGGFRRSLDPLPVAAMARAQVPSLDGPAPSAAPIQGGAGWSAALSDGGASPQSLYGGSIQPLFAGPPPETAEAAPEQPDR